MKLRYFSKIAHFIALFFKNNSLFKQPSKPLDIKKPRYNFIRSEAFIIHSTTNFVE